MRGTVVSPKRMTKEKVKEMFHIIEHGYYHGVQNLLNKSTGKQYTIAEASDDNSFITPALGIGMQCTGIVRQIRDDDKIGQLG